MAAAETRITMTNGEALSVYNNSDAVGAMMKVLTTGIAVSTSPIDFQVSSKCCIEDIVTSATAGEVEVISSGQRTGKKIRIDARYAYTASMRKRYLPRICFNPGVKYGLMVTETLS